MRLCSAFIFASIFNFLSPPLHAQTKAPAGATALPRDMLGSWGREAADCIDTQSEGRLHVTLNSLQFFDNRLTINRTNPQRGGWLRIEGMNQATGKKGLRRVSLELRMKDKDSLSLRNGPEKPEDFVRCKPALLQG